MFLNYKRQPVSGIFCRGQAVVFSSLDVWINIGRFGPVKSGQRGEKVSALAAEKLRNGFLMNAERYSGVFPNESLWNPFDAFRLVSDGEKGLQENPYLFRKGECAGKRVRVVAQTERTGFQQAGERTFCHPSDDAAAVR